MFQVLIGQNWFGEQISLEETLIKPASVSQSVLAAQTFLALCDPMDCSPPSSSVCGILQARILESVAISFSRGSFWPRDQTQVSCITDRFFINWDTREAPSEGSYLWWLSVFCLVAMSPQSLGPIAFSYFVSNLSMSSSYQDKLMEFRAHSDNPG